MMLLSQRPDDQVLECAHDIISQEDFEDVASCDIPFDKLQNASVLVTGASGFIGSRLVFTLLCTNRLRGINIKIYALTRDRKKAESVFRDVLDCPELCIVEADVSKEIDVTDDIDYIIHGANSTSSMEFITQPVDVANAIIDGTKNLLEFSHRKNIKGFVYLSSMEVYGKTEGKDRLKEEDLGYIDFSNPRSSYPQAKRMAECLCACYASQHGVPAKIVRLAQTFGAGVSYDDERVFAQFARCAIEKKDIILRSRGIMPRCYCYVSDAVAAILLVLLRGENKEVYNVANKDCTLSIREMADLVAERIAGGSIKVIEQLIDTATTGYLPEMRLVLDAGKLEALGWRAKYGMYEMYDRMIKSMRQVFSNVPGEPLTFPQSSKRQKN